MNKCTPLDYGMPKSHTMWRGHQLDSIRWCESVSGFRVTESPTGSGKTSYAKAVSCSRSVITLVETKHLQARNYGDIYGADVLYGRRNYKCIHPENEGRRCDDCLYIEEGMHKCPYQMDCHYLQQKKLVKASPFASLNYPYFLSAQWVRQEPPQVLFLDEAHNLSSITTEWAGVTVNEKNRVEWDLPDFPTISGASSGMFIKVADPSSVALEWLTKARDVMARHYKILKQSGDRDALRKCENFGRRLRSAKDALLLNASDWYIRSGPTALKFRRERRPGFVAKPLTAKYHFPHYFLNGHATIAMSATIGNPSTFTDELGIDNYHFRAVPSRFPPEARQVHVLDVPSMGRSAKHTDFEHQASMIAKAIMSCPICWCGLIHVTRKREAKLLADRLASRGLSDRVWVPPGWDGSYAPTDKQLRAWQTRKRKVPNSICISWAFYEGMDGLEEKICIVAKCPFGNIGIEYVHEQMRYSGSMYRQRTAWKLEQGLGRTRRGREQDYDLDGEMRGYVAIADGSWNRVQKYLSSALRQAIVEG